MNYFASLRLVRPAFFTFLPIASLRVWVGKGGIFCPAAAETLWTSGRRPRRRLARVVVRMWVFFAAPRRRRASRQSTGRWHARWAGDASVSQLRAVVAVNSGFCACQNTYNTFLHYLRISAARWRECVYVLQSVFFLFFFRPPKNKRQPFSLGNGWTDFHETFTKR